MEYEQPLAWLMVNVNPAIVSVPLRAAPVLASVVYCTVPLPVPDAPFGILIQEALLAAVHVQPDEAVTPTDPAPPSGGADCDVCESEYEQAFAWLIVTVRPATVAVPLRAAPPFAATVSCTVPSPVPPAPDGTLIHATLDAAVHRHPPDVSTETLTVPPAAATFC
jgi:hypothetical protein